MYKALVLLFCCLVVPLSELSAQIDSLTTSECGTTTIGCGFGAQEAKEPYTIFQVDRLPHFQEYPLEKNETKYLQEQISEFVHTHFDTTIFKHLAWQGVQLIAVRFIIQNDGEVSQIEVRARNKEMEAYTLEVFNCLPKFAPGILDHKNVAVRYSLPIRYYPEDDPQTNFQ